MYIVKMIKDLSNFDMDYVVTNVVVCKTIKTAIAEAEKVINEELNYVMMPPVDVDRSHRATHEEFVKWSNSINGLFEFYANPDAESLLIEIEEVKYVE